MKNKFIVAIIIISTIYYLRSIISFYLADIAYNSDNLTSAIALNPTEPIYYSKLGLTLSQKKDPEAISYSNIAISISPANINILKERAQTFFYLGSLDKCLATLEMITKLAPTDPKIPWLIGQFLEVGGKSNETIPYYQKAIELKDNYDDAHFALAKIYYAQKQYDLARVELEKTLVIAPQNQQAQSLLSSLPKLDKSSRRSP